MKGRGYEKTTAVNQTAKRPAPLLLFYIVVFYDTILLPLNLAISLNPLNPPVNIFSFL